MKIIELSKSGSLKIQRKEYMLFEADLELMPKSVGFGEWCHFKNSKTSEIFLGYINPYSKENKPKVHIVCPIVDLTLSTESLIKDKIKKAFDYRKLLGLKSGRYFFGEGDELFGLIVDVYDEIVLIQISTAGIDLHRNLILNYYKELFASHQVYILSNEKNREGESLPIYKDEIETSKAIKISDNNISYHLSWSVFQKNGFYFDHRDNRLKMLKIVNEFKIDKSKKCLDLFCYLGAWGFHLLKDGFKSVDFVDQANLKAQIGETQILNKLSNSGEFYQENSFNFLDKKIVDDTKYKVICSDPPAFTKTSSKVKEALEGYSRLHQKLMRVLDNDSLLFIGSCTHYVTLEDLDSTVKQAAQKYNRKIKLLEIGIQSKDHPIVGLSSKGNYIKFLAYYVH